MQVRRLRCRPGLRERAEHGDVTTVRTEDFTEKMRGRCLPVCPGDADKFERSDRIAVHDRGGVAHRLANISHLQLRNGDTQRSLDEQRYGAILNGSTSEVVSVTPESGHTAEHRRRQPGHLLRVVSDVGDPHLNVRGVTSEYDLSR